MSKPWILVSPASRGIGHALTRHLLRTTTAPILATARADLPGVRESLFDAAESEEDRTAASRRLHVARLDVTDEATVQSASAEAARLFPPSTHHLRLAFALPGILLRPEKSPRDVDHGAAARTFQMNTLGPLLLMKHFGDFLPRKSSSSKQTPATFLTLSARVGSTSDNRLGGWYTYRSSKAAVNSLVRTFDLHLRTRSGDEAVALAYHPGTVRTGLSREYWGRIREEKLFSPEFAAERLVHVVRTRKLEDRGRCWDWRGEEVLP
ncbi:hypothetical protein M426DRAFT_59456 [Hypoxylon sp. CI-4A]|nr:hypothetical protein M426DRAFT_59456 [Hypoxylon sp. CI-4A]